MAPIWSNASKLLFGDSEAAKKANVVRLRTVKVHWYCKIQPENLEFVTMVLRDLAGKYNCNVVCVRADVHDTKSVRVPEPASEPLLSNTRSPMLSIRANRRGCSTMGPRIGMRPQFVKKIMSAPWHTTIEFQKMGTGMWFTVHLYAETKTIWINGKKIPGIATGQLSQADGKDIPANPEIFQEQNFSSAKGVLHESTDEEIPIN